MIAEGIIHSTTSKPTREDMVKWVNNTMAEIQSDCRLVQNVWLKMGFEWFV
jgi:hypothetical protein